VTFTVAMIGWIMQDPRRGRPLWTAWSSSSPSGFAGQPDPRHDPERGRPVGTLTVLGILGLMWSSMGIFGSIRSALNIAWGVPNKRGFFIDFLFDVGSLLSFGLLFAASLSGTMVLHSLESMIRGISWIHPTACCTR
jgi:uncharacterized BrkB/YihY/UPF0761 family membrane protein